MLDSNSCSYANLSISPDIFLCTLNSQRIKGSSYRSRICGVAVYPVCEGNGTANA